MSVTIDELITKFSADISDYRKKTEEIKKQLHSVAGVTDIVKKETQKAMQSSSAEIRRYGSQLNSIIKTQTKQSQSLAQSASRVADYKQKVRILIETLHEQENEAKSAADRIKKLTALYEEQQKFLSDYDGGIEGVRKQRQEMLDYIHAMEAAGKSAYSTKEAEKFQKAVKRITSDLKIFDNELKAVGLNPDNLKTDTLGKLQAEIQKLVKEQSKWTVAQRATRADIDSTNRSIVNETIKINNLESEIGENARSISDLRSKISGLGKGRATVDNLKKSFSAVGLGVKKIGGFASGAFSKVLSWLKRVQSGASGSNKSLLNIARSIKRIGIVSLGLRICKSIFGELRSVVSDYLSKNEALNKKVENLKDQFAKALAPAISLVIALFERLMPYVLSVVNAIGELLSSLGIAKTIGATADAINDTADATKKLSKAQGDLYGFDQITKVSSDTDSGSKDGAAGTMSPNEQLSKYLESIKALWKNGDFEGVGNQIADSLNKVISKINGLNWKGIQDKVSTAMSHIAGAFNGFVKNFDWTGAGKTVSNGINTIITAFESLVSKIKWDSLGSALSKGVSSLLSNIDWDKAISGASKAGAGLSKFLLHFFTDKDEKGDTVLSNATKSVANIINSITAFIKSAVDELSEIDEKTGQSGWSKIGKSLMDALLKGIKNINWKDAGKTISGIITGLCDAISSFFDELTEDSEDGKTVANAIKDFIEGLKIDEIAISALKMVISVAKGVFSLGFSLMEVLTQSICDAAGWTWDGSYINTGGVLGIKIPKIDFNFGGGSKGSGSKESFWSKVKDFFGSTSPITMALGSGSGQGTVGITASAKEDKKNKFKSLKSKIDSIKGKTRTVTVKFKQDAKNKYKALKSKIDGIKNKTRTITAKFKQDARNKYDDLKSKIKGIKGKTVEISARFKDALTGALNSLIARLNNVINKLKSISIAGFEPFSGLREIPKLAQGGIVDRSTLVNVGENGKEAIMPLEKNKGWIYELARQIVEINAGASQGQAMQITIPIYVGGKHLTTVVLNDLNTRAKASKKVPIMI